MLIFSGLAQTQHSMTTQPELETFKRGGLLELAIPQKLGLLDLEHGNMEYSEAKYE